jgi:hypothetical protein
MGRFKVDTLTSKQLRCNSYTMIRTQIQLPDELYDRTKRLAASKEVSLAELVRRGLEYMLSIHRLDAPARQGWQLESPAEAGLLRDPFSNPEWRVEANMASGVASGLDALELNEGGNKRP